MDKALEEWVGNLKLDLPTGVCYAQSSGTFVVSKKPYRKTFRVRSHSVRLHGMKGLYVEVLFQRRRALHYNELNEVAPVRDIVGIIEETDLGSLA